MRSKRLVTYEGLARFLEPIASPDEKIDKLLAIEESIIGAENKRQLATVMLPIITAAAFTNHFQAPATPVMARLQRLAELQTRVLRSGMQDNKKREIAQALDKVASETEARARILDTIVTKATSHVDKVVTVLRLCTGGLLTEGQLSAKAKAIILSHLAKPGFIGDYTAHLARGADAPPADKAKSDLLEALQKAGIKPDELPRTIAA
jgi:hypothetical protein